MICVRGLKSRQAASRRKTGFLLKIFVGFRRRAAIVEEVNDQQLLAAYLQGDECALEDFIARLFDLIIRVQVE